MNIKPIIKPEVNPCFFKGEIISWQFRESITPVHKKYAIRFTITFADGTTMNKEKSGYRTRAECQKAKELYITQLNNHQFVAFNVTVKEFYDYWLYYYMTDTVKITYNTFTAYRNVVKNHLVPFLGSRKLLSIKRNDLINFFNKLQTPALLRMGYAVLGSSFKFAKANNLIRNNIATNAIKAKRGMVKKERINDGEESVVKKRPVLNATQLYNLLWTCESDENDLFLPLLITIATGIRISELIALKFDYINFRSGVIKIDSQLGRKIYTEAKEGNIYKEHLNPKSYAGTRTLLLPDFIIDEIILAKARSDALKQKNPDYENNNYVWSQANGRPHGRYDYSKPFNRLKKKLDLPDDFHWHDIRHSFCTLMVQNGANLKQLSIAMGHYSELFSLNVYTDMDFIISNGIPEFDAFIDDVLPESRESKVIIIDTMIDPEFINSVIAV
ncbi:MAG: site-specific integrase [Clostridiaceae bacterium]|nr:site-specific integrase [Clostridiaceae bacterium]